MNKTKRPAKSADQLAGKGVKHTIGGKEYQFRPLSISKIAGAATAIMRSAAIGAVQDGFRGHPNARNDAISRVARDPISIEAVHDWLATYDGLMFVITKSIEQELPLTVGEIMENWSEEEVGEAVEIAFSISGMLEESKPDDDGKSDKEPSDRPTELEPSGSASDSPT